MTDLLGGQVQFLIDAPSVTRVHAKAGTLEVIAVSPRTPSRSISDALATTLALPEVRETFATQGLDAAPSTAEAFTAPIRSEVPKGIRVASNANFKVE